jgi:prepilin-type N-terminal cleavage/methylation domain-containing protein
MKKPGNNGFSLVELLVAAAVFSLAIVSVVSMVRKAAELDMLNRHRRAAHSIIERTIESGTYQQANFNNLVAGPTTTTIPNVTIDADLPTPLKGTLTITVNVSNPTWSGIAVPQARVTFSVQWTEYGQTSPETMSIEKWISP